MRAYDLKPTYGNLLETYRKDVIGRNADIFRFTEILDAVEDGCSIALDGNWGSGKTFFIKQTKMIMDAHNQFIEHNDADQIDEIVSVRDLYYNGKPFSLQPQVCVYYDAWENDNDEDPVLSLVYTIIKSVSTDFTFSSRNFINAGASILELFTGRNWTQVVESLKSESPLDSLEAQKDIESLVGEFLDSLLPEKGNRLVVFIDELDRCKPSYAVRLLERIKHYFTHDNITFVFSVNTNELQHTIKKHYGSDFNASRYLDRFFDLRITLPKPNLKNFYRSIQFNDSKYVFDIVCDAVIKAYHFELREIAKFIRLTKIAAYEPTHSGQSFYFSDGVAMRFCLTFIVPIMIGLKLHDIPRYSALINGSDSSPLFEIAKMIDLRIYDDLLDRGETYDPNDPIQKNVALKDKLEAVYEAIFINTYTGQNYYTTIGNMQFDARTKDMLIRVTGLLSEYTKFDIT